MRTARYLFLTLLFLVTPALGETWFLPGYGWTADRLEKLHFEGVRHGPKGVGGILKGTQEGATLLFSSNRPSESMKILQALGRIERGSVLAIFGQDVTVDRGDVLFKVEFNEELPPDTISLPERGPHVELYEVVITSSKGAPAIMIGSDYLLTLQTRAKTSNEFVWVQLEKFRPLDQGDLAIDLSITYLKPGLTEHIAVAIEELAEERASSYGADVVSINHRASSQSGKWPVLRAILTKTLPSFNIVQENKKRSAFSQETFGKPTIPSLTLQLSPELTVEKTDALAKVIKEILAIEE